MLSLNENLRIGNSAKCLEYDEWLLELGNGNLPIVEDPDFLDIPQENSFEIVDDTPETIEQSKRDFIELIYPNLEVSNIKYCTFHWLNTIIALLL